MENIRFFVIYFAKIQRNWFYKAKHNNDRSKLANYEKWDSSNYIQYLKQTVDIQAYTELNFRDFESIPEGHLFC